jgi:hypothetical protein
MILKVAKEQFEWSRRNRFADFREAPVTASEARRAVLGDIEVGHYIVPSELPTAPSLSAAIRARPLDVVGVPVMIGERCVVDFAIEKVRGGWRPMSMRCESRSHDRTLARVGRALATVLGGPFDEWRSVAVEGTEWVIARRGGREAAGFVEWDGGGRLDLSSVGLPREGAVLSSDEFRVLVGRMAVQPEVLHPPGAKD